MQLTRTHRILIGVVVAGAVVIAGIGFAGSYAAVRALALQKGFGNFSLVFPIGIDMGICVLLALDLLLTWIRIPFPLLRQTAWLLTAATIAFNGAAAWPDPLGVGMHAVIPILFVVTVEAARHAVGRIADITADRHMEGVRITRWLLSPLPTFKLWRRMKLWELRSYEQTVGMEQDRLIYQARLQARYGRAWRRKAPVEALMPLRLARIGVPLSQTAPEGLAAAGIDPMLLPPAPESAGHVTVERADAPQDVPVGVPAVLGEQAMEEPADRDESLAHVLHPDIDPAHDEFGQGHPYGPEFQGARAPTQPVAPVAAEPIRMTEAELWEACRSYAARTGAAPDAAAFAVHLAEAYGVVDPVTGGPLPATEMEELLARFPGSRTALTDTGSVTGHGGEPHPFFEALSARGEVYASVVQALVSGRVPAPAASAGAPLSAAGRQQTSLDVLTDPVPAPAGETEHWRRRSPTPLRPLPGSRSSRPGSLPWIRCSSRSSPSPLGSPKPRKPA
ncbi:DUF2637 domain-containing protein [Streptomyces sp. NBC_01296]|uniref:DUF2637 domain-containing protein n=1 Tax=Streptomyces sp. NBC_01296 TaxID=2903816 RepID=UPI002E0F1EA3|nr:DUF2637 domain-containing protein [Streptomyces sp. NBC_01296]WSN53465.1 DUF2637 domain-containing protein [Streptomyces sp. NBC_01296]WSN54302.1 DUF2637 domain-containing protein [Streptomyces sp. NBC_01296]